MNSAQSKKVPVSDRYGRIRHAAARLIPALVVFGSAQLSTGQQSPTPPPQKLDGTPMPPDWTLPAPPGQTQEEMSRPLTADEAARIALSRHPNIAAAMGNVIAAQGITQQARSALLPQLTADAGYANVRRLSGNSASLQGQVTGSTASLNLQQLIFDFNHARDLVSENLAFERAASENLSLARQEVIFQVKQAFYLYVEAERLVAVNEANVTNRQSQLTLAKGLFEGGIGLASDVAIAQTAMSIAAQSLTVARNNAETSRINLALQMGVDPRTPIVPAASQETPPSSQDVSGLVQLALRQRPEILQAQANIEAGRFAVRAAKTSNAPIVLGTLSTAANGNQFLPRNDALALGVTMQFSFYNGGRTAGLVKQASGNLQTAQANLENAQLTVTSDVSQAFVNMRSAEQRIKEAVGEVASAQEGIRIALGRYRAGLGLFLDVLNAQQLLYTAQTDQATAQYAAEQARAALSRAIGAPLLAK